MFLRITYECNKKMEALKQFYLLAEILFSIITLTSNDLSIYRRVKMKKKLLALSALAVLCLPSMASCGPKDDTGSQSNDTSCKGVGKSTIVINFWHAFKNVNQKAIGDLTTKFNEANKGKICVEMSAQNDYDTIFKNITTAIQAGTGLPDIATTYPDHVATYQESNIVIDMDQYINSADETIAMPKTGNDSWEDILPSYREESQNYRFKAEDMGEGNGKTYSLPLNKSTEVMYYNKTFFDYWTGRTAKNKAGQTLSKILPDLGDTLADQIHSTGNEEADNKYNRGPLGGHIGMLNEQNIMEYKTPVEWGLKNPADIDPSDQSTWWTWSDVEQIGKIIQAITSQKYNVFAYTEALGAKKYNEVTLSNKSDADKIYNQVKTRGNIALSWDSSSNLFVTLANQVNSYVSLDQNAKPQLNFASESALNQYANFERLYDSGIVTIPTVIGDGTLKYATTPFTTEYLFLSVGSIAGAALNFGGLFETGVAPIPQASLDNPKVIQQGTNITMLNKRGSTIDITSTKEEDKKTINKTIAAWEYVKFITGHEANLHFATNTTYLPTRKSVIESEEYKQFLATDLPERKAMKIANTIAQTGATFTDPPFKNSGSIRSDAENKMKEGLTASASDMRSTITAYLEECKKTLGIQ